MAEKASSTGIWKRLSLSSDMKTKMKKCEKCSTYTFKESCPKCGGKTINPVPAKYSPLDAYGKYRRLSKK
jgi:H/ACA ribonucleoprotein complex subunit 3